jgi:hypothetical protein
MARAAEIGGSDGIELARTKDGAAAVFDFSGFRGSNMFGSRTVARLTGNAGHRITRIKPVAHCRSCRGASKTESRFTWIHPPSCGILSFAFPFCERCIHVAQMD